MKDILIVKRIKELMKEEDLKQVQLAEKLGVAQSTVNAWLLEKAEPSINSLWLLADYFEVSVDYLIGRREF